MPPPRRPASKEGEELLAHGVGDDLVLRRVDDVDPRRALAGEIAHSRL